MFCCTGHLLKKLVKCHHLFVCVYVSISFFKKRVLMLRLNCDTLRIKTLKDGK